MSAHHQFVFPRDLHLPPPDWPALEARLLRDGFILPAQGDGVPTAALMRLILGLTQGLEGGQFRHADGLRNTGDVLALYADLLPAGLPVRHDLSMQQTLALLAEHGVTPGPLAHDTEGSDWRSPLYTLGPAARDPLTPDTRAGYDADPAAFGLLLLAYHGPNPAVHAGENFMPPALPGANAPLEAMPPFDSPMDFIGAAWEDPATQWHCAAHGRDYRILELDWHYSFAIGFRMIRLTGLDQDSTEAIAAAVGAMLDAPMGCSHRHL
ncbi:hypothetical protein CEG14_14150 [Bordetella genomosp. 1]|uniref:Uncharacterized protein n=1 Tax=Bordetella genomosp. 1 TaxID=1395607 RepID=A0A261SG85_9BORD|nr:hypothetical protein [Bordetella genomosp. 1]OZI36165.1 hypothetical protein CEG14_14150 [Bordetella genomosp. 1]